MHEYHSILSKLFLAIEIIAAIIAFFYFFRLKNSHYKWFSVFLIFVATQETIWFFNKTLFGISINEYYAFIGIPVQYIFFFWLYAWQSFKRKKLFILLAIIYFLTFFLVLVSNEFATRVVNSVNINFGNLILTALVVFEFLKQIRNDDILQFSRNKMFYINVGIIIFYVGTVPFYAFYLDLFENYVELWNIYYLYSIISGCIMYLLFIASFIWGKQHS